MKLTESSLRKIIRALLSEEIEGWKPPWEGGGSGSGGHYGDRHWADGDGDYDELVGEGDGLSEDDSDDGGGDGED